MKNLFLCVVLFSFFGCSSKTEDVVSLIEVGKPDPALILKKIIQPKGQEFEGWKQFEGEFIILSFFASWRENSLDGMTKLNNLYEEFKYDSIVFIAITDESEGEVRKFSRNNKIEGWLGASVPAESFKNFRVYERPMSILINSNGIVTDFMDTNDLSQDIIRKYIGQAEVEDDPTTSSGRKAASIEYQSEIGEEVVG
jgi:thiol-disulfide isomerase/thioredoxin